MFYLRSSSAGRVGGDPPKISFLAFGAKIGSSVGVKTYQNYDALLVEEVKYVKETRLESVDGIG